ncbi:hypothetical protein [Streptomyces sp. NPDC007088]|uniref:hypothetical protein n=1 Tax=Streptomyces sp. NPDC007088 TaxID=3364773 RepID=UPI003698CA2C
MAGGPGPGDEPPGPDDGDAVLTRIGQVAILLHAGDREEARSRFTALWAEIGEDGDPLHRCTLAHYMADAQDDPRRELDWDLRALAAAASLRADRLSRGRLAPEVRSLAPTLHLNLAADYLKLDRPREARAHLGRARAASEALGDDPYGDGVRAALTRLGHRLDGTPEGPRG